jgi:hypothetical protein
MNLPIGVLPYSCLVSSIPPGGHGFSRAANAQQKNSPRKQTGRTKGPPCLLLLPSHANGGWRTLKQQGTFLGGLLFAVFAKGGRLGAGFGMRELGPIELSHPAVSFHSNDNPQVKYLDNTELPCYRRVCWQAPAYSPSIPSTLPVSLYPFAPTPPILPTPPIVRIRNRPSPPASQPANLPF